ncbi:MAG: restriction endonuclease subunit S [Candidatus Thermoplasmatota archaeon]|nr:restriction endonuclease subunit S [Candidatus Thermoplasmatota archaeon]
MTRPGYKMTEIGEIPEEWDLKRIRECAEVKYGKSNPKTEGMIPLIGSSGVFGAVSEPLICFPTIVIGRKGTAGAVWDIRTPSWPSDTSFYLEYKTEISQKFLFEFMSLNKLTGENAKTTLPSVKREEIEEFLFPFPPLQEQQKIAEILSIADETIQKVNEEITLSEKLKKELMQTLLTKGIGHTKFKMTEIGEMPEEWRNEKISKLGQIVTGGTPSTSEPAYWNGEIPWIASGDVHQRYIKMAHKFITQEGYLKSNCNLLPIGTVLIALNGQGKTRGLSAILGIEAVCNQSMAGIIPKKDILNPVYLLYHLLNRYAEIRNISGIGRNGLNLEHIANIVISCPPLIEQQKIAEILSTIDNKLELLRNKKGRLERLKKGLMGDLLTGKVRVNVNAPKGEN